MSIDIDTGLEHREFFEIDLDNGWQPVSPGIVAKTVAGSIDHDAKRGRVSRLARWEPGARIDAVRVHDFHEEVFIVEGSLKVAAQAPPQEVETFRAPSFACRPPGAKHGPFQAGPDGCLALETFFYL
jgi:hypothetical protein